MSWPAVTYAWSDLDSGCYLSQSVAVTWIDGATIDLGALGGAGSTFDVVEVAYFLHRVTEVPGAEFDAETGQASIAAVATHVARQKLTFVGSGSGALVVRQVPPAHVRGGGAPLPSLNVGTYTTGVAFGLIITAEDPDVIAGGNVDNPALAGGASDQSRHDPDDLAATDPVPQPWGQGLPHDTDLG